MPRLRRSCLISSLSTMRNSRPNLSRIWSRHWICSAAGQTISTRARPVAQDQFLDDQPGLDGLAQAHVVGDEQVDARHLDRAHHRVELVVLDVDAAAERRLQGPHVGGGGRAPAHGVEEGIESSGRIEAGRSRQRRPLADLRAGLQLPDDLQFLAQGIVLDRRQRDQMLRRLRTER